jgi:hypothetical protein
MMTTVKKITIHFAVVVTIIKRDISASTNLLLKLEGSILKIEKSLPKILNKSVNSQYNIRILF